MNEFHPPHIKDVFRETDPRASDRVLEVVGFEGFQVRISRGGRVTKVRRDRLGRQTRGRRGYRLVSCGLERTVSPRAFREDSVGE